MFKEINETIQHIHLLEKRTGNEFDTTYFGKELVIFHNNNYQEYAHNYRLAAQKAWQVARDAVVRLESVLSQYKPLPISPSSTITWKRYRNLTKKEKENDD